MKENTERILLALYPSDDAQWGLSKQVLYGLVPHLSAGGKRSLLHLLQSDGSIALAQIGSETQVYLTPTGKRLLEQRFPALSDRWATWDGKWGCCVFVEAPTFDTQFRYLRQLVLKEGFFAVSRGVYFAPFPFSQVAMTELGERYAQATTVFTIASWQFEREQSFVLNELGIADVLTAYSGVSTEITQLLATFSDTTKATDQQKAQIYTVYDRFWEALGQDPGFAAAYGAKGYRPTSLIHSLHALFSHLS